MSDSTVNAEFAVAIEARFAARICAKSLDAHACANRFGQRLVGVGCNDAVSACLERSMASGAISAKPLDQFYKDCLRLGNLKVRHHQQQRTSGGTAGL